MKNEQLVEFLKLTDATIKQAAAELQPLQDDQSRASKTAPQVVQLLVSGGLVPEAHSQAALQKLATHNGTMEILRNLLAKQAQHRQQPQAAAPLGRPTMPATPININPDNPASRESFRKFDEMLGFTGVNQR